MTRELAAVPVGRQYDHLGGNTNTYSDCPI
jgi:hypothetical protein